MTTHQNAECGAEAQMRKAESGKRNYEMMAIRLRDLRQAELAFAKAEGLLLEAQLAVAWLVGGKIHNANDDAISIPEKVDPIVSKTPRKRTVRDEIETAMDSILPQMNGDIVPTKDLFKRVLALTPRKFTWNYFRGYLVEVEGLKLKKVQRGFYKAIHA